MTHSKRLRSIAGHLFLTVLFVGIGAIPSIAQPVTGALYYETGMLRGYNTVEEFGSSISLNGSELAVGAQSEFSGFIDRPGAVHIFEERIGCDPGWEETEQLYSDDGMDGDDFGQSVKLIGDTLFVGAPGASNTGALYIYERDSGGPGSWGLSLKLTIQPAENGVGFGSNFATDGNLLIVGVPSADTFQSNGGAIFVYERNLGGPDNWGLRKQVSSIGLQPSDHFGSSVAIESDMIAVGTTGFNGGDGSTYLFQKDAGGLNSWGQVKQLLPSYQNPNRFGESVLINGDVVVVGETGYPGAGRVYIYYKDLGGANNWGELKHFSSSESAGFDNFGYVLAMQGDVLLVGSPYTGSSSIGTAFLYGRDVGGADNWGEIEKFLPANVESGDKFGTSIEFIPDLILIGASGDDPEYPIGSGSVYSFRTLSAIDDGGPEFHSTGEPFTTGNVLDNDAGESISIICVDTSMTSGLVVDNGDGTFDYTPSFQAVEKAAGGLVFDTFTYTIQDSKGNTDQGTVTIEIESDALNAYLPVVSSCKYLYYDDFSNPNSGWPKQNSSTTRFQYLGGEYRILKYNAFGFAGAIPGRAFTKYVVTTEVRNVNNLRGTYGLLFSQKSDWSGFYTFEIDRNRNYEVWKYNNGWTLITNGTSTALKPGSQTNTIAVERHYDYVGGEPIYLFANGQLIAEVYDSTFVGALRAGVWVTSAEDEELDIRYDNYRVEPTGCGLSQIVVDSLLGGFLDSAVPVDDPTWTAPAWLDIEIAPRDP